MFENWKDVVDYEGLYQVSSLGKIRRHPDKQSKNKYRTVKTLERKVHENKLGYLYATLCKDTVTVKKTVHQLVLAAFNPNFSYGNVVNHKDGNKHNNTLENLEACTHQGNNLHAHKTGLTPKPGKTSKFHNVYPQYSRDGKTITSYSARIKDMYETVYYERFKTEEEAMPEDEAPTIEEEAAYAVDSFLNKIGDTQRSRNFLTP